MNDTADIVATAGLIAQSMRMRRAHPVATPIDEAELRARVSKYNFATPLPTRIVAADLIDMLETFSVRNDHPRYFGLFNPPALPSAVIGDAIAAAINPQLAVWGHAPAAAEIESSLVRLFARCIWDDAAGAGVFTTGGSEANMTAVLAALSRRYEDWARRGLAGRARQPVILTSAESHLAWIKIARACGLGSEAVRLIPAEDGLRLTRSALARALESEVGDPLMIVATAGATAHGAVDDIEAACAIGAERGVYVHVDAAWAGGALIDPGRKHLFAGIERADSVTIDPHKWLQVPMGAGLFLSRDWTPLAEAFTVATGYMPSASAERHDAYIHSLQWSRRFIGAKLFMALATLGLDGYRGMIARSFALGDLLRSRLRAEGWRILNDTTLPLVCFAPADGDDETVRAIADHVVAAGAAWISIVTLGDSLALRACVTSHESNEADIEALIDALDRARAAQHAT